MLFLGSQQRTLLHPKMFRIVYSMHSTLACTTCRPRWSHSDVGHLDITTFSRQDPTKSTVQVNITIAYSLSIYEQVYVTTYNMYI